MEVPVMILKKTQNLNSTVCKNSYLIWKLNSNVCKIFTETR